MWTSSDVMGFEIRATDGPIGKVNDLLLDERIWSVRWVVVDTGTWLPGRKVLLPPSSFGRPRMLERRFPVDLTRRKVKDSPDIDADAPVSRQVETDVYGYYGWTPYWNPAYAPVGTLGYMPPAGAGIGTPPGPEAGGPRPVEQRDEPTGDPHLRSVNEVSGYYIEASDGEIGHVEDFLFDERDWVVRYIVVDTRNWWPGKKVLVSPPWIQEIRWADGRVSVKLTQAQVKDSPEYNPEAAVDRAYEERLHRHYGFPPYWI